MSDQPSIIPTDAVADALPPRPEGARWWRRMRRDKVFLSAAGLLLLLAGFVIIGP